MTYHLYFKGPTATSHLESGGFARSRPGIEHPDIMFHFLPSQVIDHGRKAPWMEAFQVDLELHIVTLWYIILSYFHKITHEH